jgi:hypothetical protein
MGNQHHWESFKCEVKLVEQGATKISDLHIEVGVECGSCICMQPYFEGFT